MVVVGLARLATASTATCWLRNVTRRCCTAWGVGRHVEKDEVSKM